MCRPMLSKCVKLGSHYSDLILSIFQLVNCAFTDTPNLFHFKIILNALCSFKILFKLFFNVDPYKHNPKGNVNEYMQNK